MQSLPGVANVEIDADTTTAIVSVEAGNFDAAKAVAALKDSGYAAKTVKTIESAAETESDAPAADSKAPTEGAEADTAKS